MRALFPYLLFFHLPCHGEEHTKADYLALIAAGNPTEHSIEYAWTYADELQATSKATDERSRQLHAELQDQNFADKMLEYIDLSRNWMMHSAQTEDFQRFLSKRHEFYASIHALVPGSSREEYVATPIAGPDRKVTPADAETLRILNAVFLNLRMGLTSKSTEEYRASVHILYALLHIKVEDTDKILNAAKDDHSLAKEYIHFAEEFIAGHAQCYNSRPDMVFVRLENKEDENNGVREIHVGDLNGTPHLVFMSNSLSHIVVLSKKVP